MPFLPLAHHKKNFALTLASSLLLSSVLVSSHPTTTQASTLSFMTVLKTMKNVSEAVEVGEFLIENLSSNPEDVTLAVDLYNKIVQDKILNLQDLSTFLVNYSGIATVYDSKKPSNISYHVTYQSSVKLGMDFSEIQANLNLEHRQLEVTLPHIKVTDYEVFFESLDFMFINSKSNTATVASEAYQFCINDVKVKSLQFTTERELATENAKNIIQGLMYPFLQQLGSEFTLTFL